MAEAWEVDGMRRAIVLAALGLGTTSPNPPVGCIVFDAAGRAVGAGYHRQKGDAHAETQALAAAGAAAAGGTAVVTLEPCNHFGRTPPCRKALMDAGIARVVIAVLDPTSRGDGGATELRKAGVSVEVGVCEQEALLVLGPWLAALHRSRPLVTWAYQVKHFRWSGRGPQPAVPDQADLEALRAGQDLILYADGRIEEGRPGGHGIGVFTLPSGPVPADPYEAVAAFAECGARTVMLVGGAELAGSYLAAGLVNDIDVHLVDIPATPASEGPSSLTETMPAGFALVSICRTPRGVRYRASRTSAAAAGPRRGDQ